MVVQDTQLIRIGISSQITHNYLDIISLITSHTYDCYYCVQAQFKIVNRRVGGISSIAFILPVIYLYYTVCTHWQINVTIKYTDSDEYYVKSIHFSNRTTESLMPWLHVK